MMAKLITTETMKDFRKIFEQKILSEIDSKLEEAGEIPAEAIEDIGREINDLVETSEKEVSWLTSLDGQHQELETSLIELSLNVHNMRLFTFFSFLLNVIFFIAMLLGWGTF